MHQPSTTPPAFARVPAVRPAWFLALALANMGCILDTSGYTDGVTDASSSSSASTSTDSPMDSPTTSTSGASTSADPTGADVSTTQANGSDTETTPPECGNGLREAGEACDDGNPDDTDACTHECKKASCGDGHLWKGVEVCDDGNDIETDTCDSTCEIVVRRKVFVSSGIFNGAFGGLPSADAECRSLAARASLPGHFKAWLSDDEFAPEDRFDTGFTGVYELVDGTLVDHGWAGLTDGTLVHGIDVTETGAVTKSPDVWTGTLVSGKAWLGNHCKSWTSSSLADVASKGKVGSKLGDWTHTMVTSPCNDVYRIYCFEDPD